MTVLALDHLVLAARTLGEGVDWCGRALGVRPQSGGRHVFMGTHNRVFAIGSPTFPRAYFEIIAIDPEAEPPRRARWFGLDDPALQRVLGSHGPQLVQWVARCDGIAAAHALLRAERIDAGAIEAAERATPQGLLRWQISIRADGERPLEGAAPALIEWGDMHPTDTMKDDGVVLQSVRLGGWPSALAARLPAGVDCDSGPDAPPISALFSTPCGQVQLNARRWC